MANTLRLIEGIKLDSIVNCVISMIITYFILRNINTKNNYKNFIINAIFIIYINELYSLVLYSHVSVFFNPISSYPHILEGATSLVPFKNISEIFNSREDFLQVIGNALMLSPLAFFAHYYGWSKSYIKTFIMLSCLSVFIELFQLVQTFIYSMYTPEYIRVCDVDDVMLNSLSVIIGIVAFRIYENTKKLVMIDNIKNT